MIKFLQYNLRHFRHSKIQFGIAVTGLILGWSCFISIGLFMYRELTYDRFHTKYNRIYRINYNEKTGEVPGTRLLGTVGPQVGPAAKTAFPEVEEFARFRYSPDWIVRFNAIQSYENSVWYADSSVFRIFDFPLKEGNAQTALRFPNSVVITQAVARKYFGDGEAMGKTLTMNNESYSVTGVLSEIPSNSHIRFDFLLPFHAFRVPYGYPVTMQDWGWISFYNYILLKPNASAGAVEAQLQGLVKQHFSPAAAKRFRLELQPLKDIYFGDAKDENTAEGNSVYMLVLGLSALMIIITASFNFANLFSAMSIAKAKDVGVRKMLGAGKKSLVLGINGLSVLLVLFTLIVSLLLLPFWAKLVPWGDLMVNLSPSGWVAGLLSLVTMACLIGCAAGLYPSLMMSGYSFQHLLKGAFRVSKKGVLLRKVMLVGQFVISIALLCSVFVISRQMGYLKRIDTGYAKNELMLIHMPGNEVARYFGPLRDRLDRDPYVVNTSLAGGKLDGNTGDVPIYTENTSPAAQPMNIFSVSFDFFKTAGIPVLKGREFSYGNAYDSLQGVILNESAVRAIGWRPETAMGKRIRIGDIVMDGRVIAVVKDFNYSSLHNSITPLVMYYPRSHIEDIYVRFKGRDLSRIVSSISEDWHAVLPALPFDFSFMNDHLASLYRTDAIFEKMFRCFSIIAIIIACLGFYGLLSQDIIYRVKEIAVRKVLGANSSRISLLLLRQYLFLFAIANLVAWPASYYYMSKWLNEFPYRQPVQWALFPLASLVFLVLSVFSVSYLTRRAAMANPVHSLKG